MTKNTEITIKNLDSKEDIIQSFSILIQHHKHIKEEDFLQYIDDILTENNYQMIAAYINNKMVGIAGYWVLTRFYSGRYIQVGNMVVDKKHRGVGVGKKLLNFIGNEGKKRNCKHFILDSKVENKESHKFYLQEGFEVVGYHFMKNI